MANRYWVNGGTGNWNSTTNWSATSGGASGASVPGSADDVFFDGAGNSNCTVSLSNTVLSITVAAGYTSTLSITGNFTLTATVSITLGASMTITGTGTLRLGNTVNASITSNGVIIPNLQLTCTSTVTITLNDIITCSGLLNLGNGANASILTINGNSISATGNILLAGLNASLSRTNGTTVLNINGTGNQTLIGGGGPLHLDTNINKASGTLTIGDAVGSFLFRFGGNKTLNYITGSVVVTTNTFLEIYESAILNTAGISWENVRTQTSGTITFTSAFTLVKDWDNSATQVLSGAGFFTNIGGTFIGRGSPNSLTLCNNLTCNGITTLNATTLNGFTINNTGNLTVGSSLVGTSKVILSGTGIWSGNSLINMDMDINTSGTITLGGVAVVFGQTGSGTNPIFNYISGTINFGSTFLTIEQGRYNMAGVTWQNLRTGTNGTIVTLLADINCVNFTPNSGCVLNGAFNFNVNGNLTPSSNGIQGTATIRMVGTGTWSGGTVTCNLTFNTAGTITVGNVTYGTQNSTAGNLTYTTGSVITTSGTLTIVGGTWNTSGMIWSNLFCNTNNTLINLVSDINCVNLQINNVTFTPSGGNNINISGDLNLSNQSTVGLQSSTTNYRMVGTGTISANHTIGRIAAPLVFNTLGTITLSGTIGYSNSTFTHTSGTVNAGTSTLTLGQATNFVINSTGFALNNLNPSTFNVTFSGTNGCTINNFSSGVITAGVTHTFQSLNTYNIATLQVIGTIGSPATIRSSTPSSQAILTLTNASYNYVLNVTDIDSSLGAAGFTSGGILTNATNWTTAAAALYYIGSTNYSGANLWSVISGGSPISAITAPTSSDPVIFDANSGNCIMNVAGVARSVNFTNYTNTITFSNSLTVSGNITLGSGMVIAGAGTLAVNATSTLTSNGVIFPNTLELRATATYTLADNWTINTLNIPVNATVITLNGNTLYLTNYTFSNTNKHQGSSIIYFNGYFGNGVFSSNDYAFNTTVIDTPNTLVIGNIIQLANASSFSLTHIQGSIIHTGSISIGRLATWTLSFLPNVELNTLEIVTPITTINLNSNITVRNLYFDGANTTINGITINGNYTIFTKGDCAFIQAVGFTGVPIVGTAKISLIGSGFLFSSVLSFNWQTFSIGLQIEINTDGIIRLSNNFVYLANLIYIKGTIVSRDFSSFIFRTGANIRGAGRMNLNRVSIVGGATITMDEFFSGTPQVPTTVTSTTTANYTINFTDGFEKLAKNVRVSRCTIARRGQLLLLSKGGFGVNNLGVRYYNQLPNGVSTDTQKFVNNNLAGMPPLRAVNMLVGDPVFT